MLSSPYCTHSPSSLGWSAGRSSAWTTAGCRSWWIRSLDFLQYCRDRRNRADRIWIFNKISIQQSPRYCFTFRNINHSSSKTNKNNYQSGLRSIQDTREGKLTKWCWGFYLNLKYLNPIQNLKPARYNHLQENPRIKNHKFFQLKCFLIF